MCAALYYQPYDHHRSIPDMKQLSSRLNLRPTLFYLIVFLLMIVPGIVVFFAAQAGSGIGAAVLLALVILANVAVILN